MRLPVENWIDLNGLSLSGSILYFFAEVKFLYYRLFQGSLFDSWIFKPCFGQSHKGIKDEHLNPLLLEKSLGHSKWPIIIHTPFQKFTQNHAGKKVCVDDIIRYLWFTLVSFNFFHFNICECTVLVFGSLGPRGRDITQFSYSITILILTFSRPSNSRCHFLVLFEYFRYHLCSF